MAEAVKAPDVYNLQTKLGIFLAGSIEMGKAENWQERVTKGLQDEQDIVILNPRRDDWDSTWTQSISNPQFYEQVTWELQAQEDANVIVMYFDPSTKSPITLLELGIFSQHKFTKDGLPKKMIVCCPEGFWRKGNVDITCERYAIQQVSTIDELVEQTRKAATEILTQKLSKALE